MQHDWILDVLADLNTFAKANGLGALAEQLDDAKLVAATEIASLQQKAQAQAYGDTGAIGSNFGGVGRHQRA
ncbi:hypothetical protein CFI11_20730 [Thalassococcus sp. S3]|nr:hypothetical protein CFI11_20730 [Thalassococcus sp. S3]